MGFIAGTYLDWSTLLVRSQLVDSKVSTLIVIGLAASRFQALELLAMKLRDLKLTSYIAS